MEKLPFIEENTTRPMPPEVVTQQVSPEKLKIMQEVASRLGIEGLAVTVVDPANQEQLDEFIRNIQLSDRYKIQSRYIGLDRVRTPEQIKKSFIEGAQKRGNALVAITKPEDGDLSIFWNQVEELSIAD